MNNNLPTDYISEFEYATSQSEGGNDSSSEMHATFSPPSHVHKRSRKLDSPLLAQKKNAQYEKDFFRHQSFSERGYLLTMDSLSKHNKLMEDYVALYCPVNTSKSDNIQEVNMTEVVKEHERFIWHEGDDLHSWGSRLAKRYWDRLFKEYCLIDLTRFKQNKFGMRWRREKEVITGKGQFICGDYRCEGTDDLRSWEVKFNYEEKFEKRSALVKVRLCPMCSRKLNHRHRRAEVTKIPSKKRILSTLDDDIVDKDVKLSTNLEEIRRDLSESDPGQTMEDEDNHESETVESHGLGSLLSRKDKKKDLGGKDEDFSQYIDDLLL